MAVLLGKIKGRKVYFKKNEFGEYEISSYGDPVDLEIYFDPVTCEVKALLDGREVASTYCSTDLYVQLLQKGIEGPASNLNDLPRIGNIWIPEEVEAVKKELEEISKKGSIVYRNNTDLMIRAVRKVSENEYEEYKMDFKEGNDFAYVIEARYFIIKNENKESIRKVWKGYFMNFFKE